MLRLIILTILLGLVQACNQENTVETNPLVSRGRAVYISNCTACHSVNPLQSGGLGPDVADASLELLESRLLRGSYPEGYMPKRDSRSMPAMPYLKTDIPALHAYLRAVIERR